MFDKKNFENIIQQAQNMQKKIQNMHKEISTIQVIGESGAGLVKITTNGNHEYQKIEIDESLLKKNKKEMLEDLILAALNDTNHKINEQKKNKMFSFSPEKSNL